MARKKVREYTGKRLLKAAMKRLFGLELPIHVAQVKADTNFIELLEQVRSQHMCAGAYLPSAAKAVALAAYPAVAHVYCCIAASACAPTQSGPLILCMLPHPAARLAEPDEAGGEARYAVWPAGQE
jgi:hypothetical protein